MFDWNGDGKRDMLDHYINYKVYQDVMHGDDESEEQNNQIMETEGPIKKNDKQDRMSWLQFVTLMSYIIMGFVILKRLQVMDIIDSWLEIVCFIIGVIFYFVGLDKLVKFTNQF